MLIDTLIDLLVEGLLGWHGVLLEEDAAARLFNLVVYDGCFVVTDLLLSLGLKARMRSVSLFTCLTLLNRNTIINWLKCGNIVDLFLSQLLRSTWPLLRETSVVHGVVIEW